MGFAHTNFEYSFKNITFCHCWVWKKQLYLSKISINTHETGSFDKEATLWDLNTQILNIHSRILQFVNVEFGRNNFISQRSPHETGSFDKEATFWVLTKDL